MIVILAGWASWEMMSKMIKTWPAGQHEKESIAETQID